jgi:hypothetical protein
MFSRSITDDSRSVNDTARVVRMTTIIVNDTPSCGVTPQLGVSFTIVILMTQEVSFMIAIFL